MLLGDFNNEPEEKHMPIVLNTYHFKSIVKQKTCFKNPDRPNCIDLILTNSYRSFEDTCRNWTLRFSSIGCYCPWTILSETKTQNSNLPRL